MNDNIKLIACEVFLWVWMIGWVFTCGYGVYMWNSVFKESKGQEVFIGFSAAYTLAASIIIGSYAWPFFLLAFYWMKHREDKPKDKFLKWLEE